MKSVRKRSSALALALLLAGELAVAMPGGDGQSQGGGAPAARDERAAAPIIPPPPVPPAVASRDSTGRATVRAVRLTEPFRLDGRLDEAVYEAVPPISDFVQSVPEEGAPATESTDVWVMFDDENLYVGARCWDSATPDHWVVNELRRDLISPNENFGIAFDTFLDRRNGVMFYTNPLGGRQDFAMTDEGNPNVDWNPVWDVRSGRFPGGWTVEMVIPFKSLRYRSGPSQTWGIQLRRGIIHKNEWTHLTRLPSAIAGNSAVWRLSMAGTLVGLEVPPASKNLEIKPYAISRMITDRGQTQPVTREMHGEVGVDVKYGVTANLTADLSYNTDFAQVEVDQQQVNLTRFSLFFPEKREFFLEGRGIFEFGRTSTAQAVAVSADTPYLFYSRRIGLNGGRIVPIDAGGRLTGKVGKFNVGLMNIQTGPESASRTPATNFTVLRVKRDVLRSGSVGAVFTNRSESRVPGRANRAFGLDATFSFFSNVSMSGYAARTQTADVAGDEDSYQGRFDYGADRYGLHVEHLRVGRNFNPEVGFVRRSDFALSTATARFSPRLKPGSAIRRFIFEGRLEYVEDGSGTLESRDQGGRLHIELNNGDAFNAGATRSYERLVRPFAIASGVAIAPGGYTFSDMTTEYTFGPQRPVKGRLALQRGQFYDGTITGLRFSSTRVSLSPRFSVEPGVTINRVDLPAGRFTTRLLSLRSDYGFSPRMFASAIVQYSSSDYTLGSNLRFRWEYVPGSELFVVYTDEHDTVATGTPLLKNRSFAVKINRLFNF